MNESGTSRKVHHTMFYGCRKSHVFFNVVFVGECKCDLMPLPSRLDFLFEIGFWLTHRNSQNYRKLLICKNKNNLRKSY